MLAFAATDWLQLLPLMLLMAATFCLLPSLASSVLPLCWRLRWFLLFTLLMHVLFSPGRTLWGLSWLSFDGLLSGVHVCLQMLLAVVISALLAVTTSTKRLASAFGWFVTPLQWLGCKTDEWQKVLLLTMDFIPVVQAEIRVTAEAGVSSPVEPDQSINEGRWTVWTKKLQCLLLRLVDRGDKLAHQIVADEETSQPPVVLSPLFPMALLDQLFSLLITLLVVIYWLAG
jgi:energy-coupling factor transport system permease protein